MLTNKPFKAKVGCYLALLGKVIYRHSIKEVSIENIANINANLLKAIIGIRERVIYAL